MAEYKQYITQIQENGTVMISEDVVAAIVEHAVCEVEGVSGLCNVTVADLVDMIGKKGAGRGMKIQIAEDNSLTIDCNVLICFGSSVVDVAAAVQSSVSNAVESVTGVTVKAVNVNVCGIGRQ